MELKKEIVLPLLEWYDANQRILPWRGSKDPYHIWVSEIMLQQTRVEAVRPYFGRFLDACPDIKTLAGMDEERLLKLWEGLGYYNRVRNLQKAARQIMEEYNGRMPATYELLIKLPGIGEYTAGAVASIAFNEPRPAVDGNVLRIIARLTGDTGNILEAGTRKNYRESLERIFPADRPGDFNQAMMELGATLCQPAGKPKCEGCPWNRECVALREHLTDILPVRKKKDARRIDRKTVLVIRDDRYTLIRKRSEKGLLAGMYEFPMLDGRISRKAALDFVETLGLQPVRIESLGEAVHIFTHREWHMQGFLIRIADTDKEKTGSLKLPEHYRLILPEEIDETYPIPSAYKAFRSHLF